MTKNRKRSEGACIRRACLKRTRRALKRARAAPSARPATSSGTASLSRVNEPELPPVLIDASAHPADKRAVELYKLAFVKNRTKEEEILNGITDGSALPEACEWGNLKGLPDPAQECPTLRDIRKLFADSIESLKDEAGVAPLKEWLTLSREEQASADFVWESVAPLVKRYAGNLRLKLRALLHVTEVEPENCPVQVNLMKAMLDATCVDQTVGEDTFVQQSIAEHGGVPIGIENEIEASPLWPEPGLEVKDDDTELTHFAGDAWRNYRSADELRDKVLAYIRNEVEQGHMVQWTSLPEGAIPSRIGAIEKPLKPDQLDADIRVIDDLRRSGVNGLVRLCNSTIKLPGVLTTAFIAGRIKAYWRRVDPGTEPDLVCIERDVSSAFRHFPIKENEVKFCVNCIPSQPDSAGGSNAQPLYFAHTRLPFGLCTSPTLWVRGYTGSSRLSKRIFCFAHDAEGLQMYIDDGAYFTIRSCALDRLLGLLLLDEVLGFIMSYPKIRVSSHPRLLGYQWDLSKMTVGVPSDKQTRLSDGVQGLLSDFSSDGRVDIAALKKTTGRLAWLCHVCKALRPCLKNLYATIVAADKLRVKYPYASRIHLAKEAVPDLQTFAVALMGDPKNPASLTVNVPASFLLGCGLEEEFSVDSGQVSVVVSDACPKGLAGITVASGKAYWFMLPLQDPQSSPVSQFVTPHYHDRWSSRDIAPLELLASYCGCLLAANDRPALVLSDNQGTVDSINKLSSKSGRMSRITRELSRAWCYGRGLRAFHLGTKENWLVDALSRQPSIEAARQYMDGSTMTEVDMAMLLEELPSIA